MKMMAQTSLMANLELVCKQSLELVGGATSSVFPKAEALLLANAEVQEALVYFGSKQDMSRYRSLMDFLFCEATGCYKSQCRAFYEDRGPPLRDILSEERIRWYEHWLAAAIAVAHWLHTKQKRWLGWQRVRRLVSVQAKVSITDAGIYINLTGA